MKIVPVTLAERLHPFPSRTRKLSSPAPKILGGQPPGKIGRRRDIHYVSPVGFTGGAVGILQVVERICPLLGLQADRRTVIDGVDSGHRCHAEEPPGPLERPLQVRLCLTDTFERCERYLAERE